MGLFDGKSKRELELERENKILKEKLARQTAARAAQSKKKVLYQCRYCSYKSVRNATDGTPLPGVNNCPRHPKGANKGPHSWMRTYL